MKPDLLLSAYCDTSSLLSNLTKDKAPKPEEAKALSQPLHFHTGGKLKLMRSNVVVREVEKTKDANQRSRLLSDFMNLIPVAKDEKVYGFSEVTDPYSRARPPAVGPPAAGLLHVLECVNSIRLKFFNIRFWRRHANKLRHKGVCKGSRLYNSQTPFLRC
jgi:hypothetical protein